MKVLMGPLWNIFHDKVREIYPAKAELMEKQILQVGLLVEIEQFKHEQLRYPDLVTLLGAGRNAESYDGRDKVYALLGMMDSTISSLVIADYNAPESEVFRNFSRAVIKASGKLDIIYFSGLDTFPREGFPSWVADWSRQSLDIAFNDIAFCDQERLRASGDSKHNCESDGDETHLICKGIKFDIVCGLGCDLPVYHDSAHSVVPSIVSLKPNNVYTDDGGIKNALWETFTLGRMADLPPTLSAHFRSLPWFNRTPDRTANHSLRTPFYRYFDAFQKCNCTLEIAGKSLEHYFPKWTENFEALPEEIWTLHVEDHNILLAMLDRGRLMTTGKGYVGSVPKNSQRRDLICVLQGCDVPVVLRPLGNAYKLVGHCYVHGIVKGETFEGLEKGEYKLERVTLC
jgi:hypothetical protein